jgi:hypothetical protein
MDSSISRPASREHRRNAALWIGALAGPLVWLSLLQTNYLLAYVACETGRTWFMHLAAALAVLLVAAAGLVAWRASDGPLMVDERLSGPLDPETHRQRSRWMRFAGVALSGWFIVVILATEIPLVVLRECQ